MYKYLFLMFFLFVSCAETKQEACVEEVVYSKRVPIQSPQLSFLNVNGFSEDSLGYMWIATLGGLSRYNGYEYLHYTHDDADSTSINHDFVFSVFYDSTGRLWVGTMMGVNCYDFEGNGFEVYDMPASAVYSFFEDHTGKIWVASMLGPGWIDTEQKRIVTTGEMRHINLYWEDEQHRLWMGVNGQQGLAVQQSENKWEYITLPDHREVICQYTDPQGLWWLGTNAGLVVFDPVTRSFRKPPIAELQQVELNKTQVNFIQEVEPLKILIGTTMQGCYLYDFISNTLTHNEPRRYNPFESSQLLSYYSDRRGNVWIGSYDKGFTIVGKHPDYFNDEALLSDLFDAKFVTRIIQDSAENLWIATRYKGLYRYSKEKKITTYNRQNSDLFPSNNEFLETIFIDSQDRLWLGFNNNLIIGKLDKNGDIKKLHRIELEHVRIIREAPNGDFWLGTWSGLYRIHETTGSEMQLQKLYQANVPDICIFDNGDVLFSSYSEGILHIPANDTLPQTYHPSGIAEKMPDATYQCVTIYKDSRERLWFGSYGKGIVCYTDGVWLIYSVKDGLPNSNVLCVQEDRNGDIWMSTSRGLSRLSLTATDTTFFNYSMSDKLTGHQFHEKAGLRAGDGRIFFGGNHGLTFFYPERIQLNNTPPVIRLEDLKIHNQSIRPMRSGSVLTKDIALTERIVLNHRQTTLSIDYAGIDFITPGKLTYKYMMEGIDSEWNEVDQFRRASYANLPAGKYTFRVHAINGDGFESVRPATLSIIVRPAPWFTWQAWILYGIVLFTIVFVLFRLWFRTKMNRQLLEIEYNERQREKEVSEMKINFFTNISHELRTPLTLISAPLEQLLSGGESINENNKRLLQTISRNVQSMMRLINQLLDFRKVENGVLSLEVQQTDVILLIRSVLDVFAYPTERKKIDLRFNPHTPSLLLWTDTDKIEKILHNLLSNALKHTPANGEVEVYTTELSHTMAKAKYPQLNDIYEASYLEIIVSDTGSGIPEEKMGDLFVRYRQIRSSSGHKPDYSGSGIGLHYTKCLVEKHYGAITACIRSEKGMLFSFILPMKDVYMSNEKESSHREFVASETNDVSGSNRPLLSGNGVNATLPTILIAEDNIELMDFMRVLLSEKYRLIEALNGDDAWRLVEQESPDLILSDIIMPGMSGTQLCARVKNHPAYSHIPVILLTAKTTILEQVEGLGQGADVYICKPFHVDYLLLTIKNMFLNRDRLRQYYATPQTESSPELQLPERMSPLDRNFMDKLTRLLENKLSDPDINIDYIAREVGFSRTGFYRKLKGVTDMSPVDFLTNFRLKRAAEMIVDGAYTLTEIADQTGFSSYSYFSKSFKKHFGVSPKDYR